MNEINNKDLIYGSTLNSPEYYQQFVVHKLTKKEKIKIFFKNTKHIIYEIIWFLFFWLAIVLQIISLSYLAGMFFKMGYK